MPTFAGCWTEAQEARQLSKPIPLERFHIDRITGRPTLATKRNSPMSDLLCASKTHTRPKRLRRSFVTYLGDHVVHLAHIASVGYKKRVLLVTQWFITICTCFITQVFRTCTLPPSGLWLAPPYLGDHVVHLAHIASVGYETRVLLVTQWFLLYIRVLVLKGSGLVPYNLPVCGSHLCGVWSDPLGILAAFCYFLIQQRSRINPPTDKELERLRGEQHVVVRK